ncbi:U-box domain-containing protein 5 [Jatropha curcas]|uniref:U-box domain-containing protein 5 n=1 Tax=Jatropha curcas TaxID=180498 RepID=UPI001893C98D|nr:U-box domain-containing protein 5 [Jatropha curcas]
MQVHGLICLQLKNFLDRISQIFSAIECARPRSSAGLQALCSLHVAMEKGKLLIQHCSECSKLYLAFKADKILLRCENIRSALDLCLSQIQNMVPTFLAAKISGIVEDLRRAKFQLESSEDEAGKVVKELIRQDIPASDSINNSELEALEFASVRLKITSPLAVLIEKRSIKKLHNIVRDSDPKKKILDYLYYLLRKYGELIGTCQTEGGLAQHEEHKSQTDNSAAPEPPPEFKCPISMRLMYDPVIIASGKTYERVWIEKWFSEGNDECPMTHVRLENLLLIPNVAMKGLISKWCSTHGITVSEPCVQSLPPPVFSRKLLSFKSISSIGSSMYDLHLQVSNVSLRSTDIAEDDNKVDFSKGLPQMTQMNAGGCINHLSVRERSISLASFSKLDSLPWESRCKTVHDIKEQLYKNDQACDFMFDNSYVKPLVKFLKDAYDFCDVKAQNESAEVLLAILNKSRIELRPFDEDAMYMLASFLDSEITGKALAILELLSCTPFYKSGIVASGVLPSVLKVLDSQIREFRELSMKILYNLSRNSDIAYHIVYLDCIAKLVPFLGDQSLSGYCLGILDILCDIEEGRNAIAETNSCIASIATLVETGTKQEQETAMEILFSLCHQYGECFQQVIGESIIKTLFSISTSINENPGGKILATELLQMLGYAIEGDVSDCSVTSSGLTINSASDSGNDNRSKGKKSPSKGFGYIGRKITRFFNHSH